MPHRETMTPRERLSAALDHETPDRVPISTYELSGYNSQAFENNDPSYKTLMDAIREMTEEKFYLEIMKLHQTVSLT